MNNRKNDKIKSLKKINRTYKLNAKVCIIVSICFIIFSFINCIIGINDSRQKDLKNAKLIEKTAKIEIESAVYEIDECGKEFTGNVFFDKIISKKTIDEKEDKKIMDYLNSFKTINKLDYIELVIKNNNKIYSTKDNLISSFEESLIEKDFYKEIKAGISNKKIFIKSMDRENPKDIAQYYGKIFYDNTVVGYVYMQKKIPSIYHIIYDYGDKYETCLSVINKDGVILCSTELPKEENIFKNDNYSIIKNSGNSLLNGEMWSKKLSNDIFLLTNNLKNTDEYYIVQGYNTSVATTNNIWEMIIEILLICIITFIIYIFSWKDFKKMSDKLNYEAYYDELTGVKNRKCYEKDIDILYNNINKYSKISIGIFDMNGLKYINDTYGHEIGDLCIREFSKILSSVLNNFSIYRIGGDEFVVIFKDIEEDEVKCLWGSIQHSMKEANDKFLFPVDSAFGYSFYDRIKHGSLEDTFKSADKKMYKQKFDSKKQRI